MVDEYEFDGLQRELRDVRSDLSGLQEDQDSLLRRVRDLEDEQAGQSERVDELVSELGEVPTDLAGQQDSLGGIEAALNRLEGRLDWLEHHVRRNQGLSAVDFDRPDAGVERLANAIRSGLEVQARYLDDTRRGALEGILLRREHRESQHLSLVSQAIQHSRTLAAGYEDRVAEAFDHLYSSAIDEAKRIEAERVQFEDARNVLLEDDQRRAESEGVIQAGEEAGKALRKELGDQISEAVSQRQLLPVWLTAELGYSPRAGAAAWLDTAAEVLMYRITYGVRDPVVALGSTPSPGRPGQKEWREQLVTRLRRWR